MRVLRERLGYSLEKVGVAIGIEESAARARLSRYELGVHEPPYATAKLIASALGASVAYLYCEHEHLAELLLKLQALPQQDRRRAVQAFIGQLEVQTPASY